MSYQENVPPMYRTTDPATSREAAKHMVAAGGAEAMQAKALEAVRQHPGATATELAHAAGIGDPRKLNRRLPELERAGLVERGEARTCTITGRRAATWGVA